MASATAKKTTKVNKGKAESNGHVGRAKKEGLRAPQIRILDCLAKSKAGLSRVEIAQKAPVDQAACVEYLGSHDPEVRKANDAKHFPSLITLGHVKAQVQDVDGKDKTVHFITVTGRKALEQAKKAEKK